MPEVDLEKLAIAMEMAKAEAAKAIPLDQDPGLGDIPLKDYFNAEGEFIDPAIGHPDKLVVDISDPAMRSSLSKVIFNHPNIVLTLALEQRIAELDQQERDK